MMISQEASRAGNGFALRTLNFDFYEIRWRVTFDIDKLIERSRWNLHVATRRRRFTKDAVYVITHQRLVLRTTRETKYLGAAPNSLGHNRQVRVVIEGCCRSQTFQAARRG